jgi:ATP-dependent protease ClpP protease subunit
MLVLKLFGVIGWEISLECFAHELREMRIVNPEETITLKINSPGGDCREAWGIAHLVESDGNIDTMNIGLAASAAGFILQKGKRRLSAANSMTMMHRTQLFVDGDATELEKIAAVLKEFDGEIVKVIANRTKITDEAEIYKLLEAPGWWRNSDNALADGLIDEIITTETKQPLPKNSIDFVTKNYSTLPFNVLNQIITIPTNATETTHMTPEQINALAAAIVLALQPLTDAITKLVDVEKTEPTDPATAENATKAIVNAAIEPAITAMNTASEALKTSNDALVGVVQQLANIPAPNNQAAPFVYGQSPVKSSDEQMQNSFIR